jgi:hypothetical protein
MRTKLFLIAGILIGASTVLGSIANAAVTNPFKYYEGGTGTTTAPIGQLLYGGATAYQSVATTTASCSGSASCTPFTVIGSSPITISGGGGGGGTGTVATSTHETTNYSAWWSSTSATPATLMATSSMYLQSNGDVGVGTTTDLGLFGVYNTNAATTSLAVSSSAVNAGSLQLCRGDTNICYFTASTTGAVGSATGYFSSASGYPFGIGVSTPLNLLDVGAGMAIGSGLAGVTTAPTNGLLVLGGMGIGTTSNSMTGLEVYSSTASSSPLLIDSLPSYGGCIILKDVAGTGYTQIYAQAGTVSGKVHTGALTACN